MQKLPGGYDGRNRSFTSMIKMAQLGLLVRKWVPDWLALASVFIVISAGDNANGS